MSIDSIRFRNEGALVVLQVCERTDNDGYYGGRTTAKWRDATTEDLLHVANYTRAYDAINSELSEIRSLANSLRQPDEFQQDHSIHR